MRLVLVTPPTVEPLSATEAKTRLGIGSEISDATMDSFIKAARQKLDGPDGLLQRALNTQTWKLLLPGFPCEPIMIPLPPLISISSVRYYDSSGVLQTIDPASYEVLQGQRPALATISNTSWPNTQHRFGAVEITFIAGYGPLATDVPEPIRSAIALLVSHMRSMSAQNLFLSEEQVDGIGSKKYVVGGNAGAAIDATVSALLFQYRVLA
ncbi:hypothetical protein RPMA_12430 [Tardiphaga alba]|uniref:PhiE125 gp8 family phage protein n=1 Tax=Tardiphaga alba TaxID=340268 RepID=A0ABX8A7C7_9BRAD|nr:hypothetical protein [Tardiphaga alba]QUS39553.1 hypothetical protein RPMA_12430 [Tardiphaga alba]